MHRESVPVESLSIWMQLNSVKLNSIKFKTLPGVGISVVATQKLSGEDNVLMMVPQELVLSLENVWVYAKADLHLLQLLEAVGDYARVLRASRR